MAIPALLRLIFFMLIVSLSGCTAHELASGNGSIVVQYDRSTGICQIDLHYRGKRYQQIFTEDSDSKISNPPIALLAFKLNFGDHDGYAVSGRCSAHPEREEEITKDIDLIKLNAVQEFRLSVILPSPSLKVSKNKILHGVTLMELAKTGFSVKFTNRNKPGVTSLPHIFDDESTKFSDTLLRIRDTVIGIKVNREPWCSEFIPIKSGTLQVFPEDDFTQKINKQGDDSIDTIEKLSQLPRWPLDKWLFRGVISGYNC